MAKGPVSARNVALQHHVNGSVISPTNILSVAKDTVDPSLAALFQSSVGTFAPTLFGAADG